jgi:hypothetical protein
MDFTRSVANVELRRVVSTSVASIDVNVSDIVEEEARKGSVGTCMWHQQDSQMALLLRARQAPRDTTFKRLLSSLRKVVHGFFT